MTKNKIKLIIFDAGGVAWTAGYKATCKYLAKKFNRDWPDIYKIICTKYFTMATERKITQKDAWKTAVKELRLPIEWQEVRQIYYDFINRNEKIIDFAESMKNKVITLVLSKNTRSQFSDVTKKLKLKNSFDYLMNTWELNLPKSSKKTLKYLMKKFKAKPEEIIYIDDQEENLIAAKKLGVKIILYKNFKQFKKEIDKII